MSRLLPIALGCALLAVLPRGASAQSPAPIWNGCRLRIRMTRRAATAAKAPRTSPRSCRTRSATCTASRSRTTPTSTTARTRARRTSSTSSRSSRSTSTADWNVITRTILPLIWQPSLQPATVRAVRHRADHVLGLPVAEPSRSTAGSGASARSSRCRRSAARRSAPTSGAAGPTAVLVYMKGPWVAGVLANNVWSFGGTPGAGRHQLQRRS